MLMLKHLNTKEPLKWFATERTTLKQFSKKTHPRQQQQVRNYSLQHQHFQRVLRKPTRKHLHLVGNQSQRLQVVVVVGYRWDLSAKIKFESTKPDIFLTDITRQELVSQIRS